MTTTLLMRGRKGNPKSEEVTSTLVAYSCPATWCGCNCEHFAEKLDYDGTVRKWSDPTTWESFGKAKGEWETPLPAKGDRVTIPANRKVILDTSPPHLNMLVVAGILEVSPHFNLTLSAINIVVRGEGRLSVGNATAPHPPNATAEIVLHGDRLTPGFRFNGVNYGAKSMVVFGKLELIGHPRLPRWAQLYQTADVGDKTIKIAGSVDWHAGDTVIVTATSYDGSHVDEVQVASVAQANGIATLTLTDALKYKHFVGQEQYGSRGIKMTCEVMLVDSNVVVRGGDIKDWAHFHSLYEQEFGGHISVTTAVRWDPTRPAGQQVVTETGEAQLQDISVRNAGHAGEDRRAAVEFFGLKKTPQAQRSYVKRCSVYFSYNDGIAVLGSSGIRLEGNAIYYTLGSTYFVWGERDNVIQNNLGFRTVAEVTHNGAASRSNLKKVDWYHLPGTFDIYPGNWVINNTAAGSERFGFKNHGVPCTGPDSEMWTGSVVHSCTLGVVYVHQGGVAPSCVKYTDMTIWKARADPNPKPDCLTWDMTM